MTVLGFDITEDGFPQLQGSNVELINGEVNAKRYTVKIMKQISENELEKMLDKTYVIKNAVQTTDSGLNFSSDNYTEDKTYNGVSICKVKGTLKNAVDVLAVKEWKEFKTERELGSKLTIGYRIGNRYEQDTLLVPNFEAKKTRFLIGKKIKLDDITYTKTKINGNVFEKLTSHSYPTELNNKVEEKK